MRKIIPALIVLSLLSIFLGVYIGPVGLSPSDVTSGIAYGVKVTLSRFFPFNLGEPPKYFSIIWKIRLPEVLLAYLVGLSLASAGVASQALFRNPLADPYIIGISSGAAFGAALSLLVGITYMPYLSLAFSFLSVFIVYSLARTNGKVPVDTLLLAGIAYGFLANAATWYIYVTHPHNAYITWTWLLGSFNGAEWKEVLIMLVVSSLGTGFLIWKWRELNLILLGEESIALGLDLHLYRKVFLGVIATLTAFAVYTSGVIGFVGLVSPHIMRIILGPNHRELTPSTALFGGILLVVADLLARTVAKPQVIPVGIITAFMGAPFFLYLLMKHKRGELMR
ncbi:ABC-type iron(III)-siderophore transport system, permease component [Thermococcus kodakarensis KOD1]|uniref:ABC-type iron(III)-siderophore transport system, permease component n=1 Tax=Thermococcus kodakarensis (strain ATCC BAA-918 / JCM 12380 / KOD1) TaxID=69014 RepID=Q5JHL6_THEKO|nr:iron ABC transporter permease [Thermococcus kodakarensis]WCN28045.1 iron ABC transporter permease [Thermococcus kodakarensis]WCN30342.1 iron ABC transporter permease [Thermococcus kodakarensis]BAD86398.1 ABC-type iron(III)-siderophore transport system, permease component [Thermococcus kodakarensis KOD1]